MGRMFFVVLIVFILNKIRTLLNRMYALFISVTALG